MTSGLTRFGGPRTVVCNLGTSGSLPAHQPGVAYSGTFSVTNRVGTVTAELVSATPALPAGWSLQVNQATGVVTLAWPAAAPVSAPPLPNLDFEAGAANWLLGNAWIIDGAGLQDGGTQAGRYRGAGQSSLRHAQAVPVTPGTTITASARISKGTARADFGGGAVVLEWLTSAGEPLSFSVGNVVNTGTAAFQTSTVTATAPAGAGLVRLAVSATRDIKGRASDSVYVDNVTWNHAYTLPGATVTSYAVVIRVLDGRGCQATLSQTIGDFTLSLITNRSSYTGLPPSAVSGATSLLSTVQATDVSPQGYLVSVDNSSQDRAITALSTTTGQTPWATATPPTTDLRTWACFAFSPTGRYLVASIGSGGADQWQVRLYENVSGTWVQRTNTGAALTQTLGSIIWSADETRFAGSMASSASRWQVYDITGTTFARVVSDSVPNPPSVSFPLNNSMQDVAVDFVPGSKSVIVLGTANSQNGTVNVVTIHPSVSYGQQVARPATATGGANVILCKFIASDKLLVCWNQTGTIAHLYNWNGATLSYDAPAPWQPTGGYTARLFSLSKNRRYLAYHPGGASGANATVLVDLNTWSEVVLPSTAVTGAIEWLDWAS